MTGTTFIAVYCYNCPILSVGIVANLLLCLIHKSNFILGLYSKSHSIDSFGTVHSSRLPQLCLKSQPEVRATWWCGHVGSCASPGSWSEGVETWMSSGRLSVRHASVPTFSLLSCYLAVFISSLRMPMEPAYLPLCWTLFSLHWI